MHPLVLLIAVWMIAAPQGYVVGSITQSHLKKKDRELAPYLPWLCALFPPAGAVIALMLITKEGTKK